VSLVGAPGGSDRVFHAGSTCQRCMHRAASLAPDNRREVGRRLQGKHAEGEWGAHAVPRHSTRSSVFSLQGTSGTSTVHQHPR
jgi:hypothetical protein